jgi:hypothetical protein
VAIIGRPDQLATASALLQEATRTSSDEASEHL